MSGKNSSIDQIWCRVLTETLILVPPARRNTDPPDVIKGIKDDCFLVQKMQIVKKAVQRPREAYFINRHTTFYKEQNNNFSEHKQKRNT